MKRSKVSTVLEVNKLGLLNELNDSANDFVCIYVVVLTNMWSI